MGTVAERLPAGALAPTPPSSPRSPVNFTIDPPPCVASQNAGLGLPAAHQHIASCASTATGVFLRHHGSAMAPSVAFRCHRAGLDSDLQAH